MMGVVPALTICTCVHIITLSFEWDRHKARINRLKHRVEFSDATAALEDPMALTVSAGSDVEDRWATLGRDALGRLLVVVYTWRGNSIRIMSARKATKRERREYEAR